MHTTSVQCFTFLSLKNDIHCRRLKQFRNWKSNHRNCFLSPFRVIFCCMIGPCYLFFSLALTEFVLWYQKANEKTHDSASAKWALRMDNVLRSKINVCFFSFTTFVFRVLIYFAQTWLHILMPTAGFKCFKRPSLMRILKGEKKILNSERKAACIRSISGVLSSKKSFIQQKSTPNLERKSTLWQAVHFWTCLKRN